MNNNSSNIIKEMFMVLLPIQILSLITSNISTIINGLLIGNFLNADDLIALGFVGPLLTIVSAFSSVISGGARVACGRLIGRGKLDDIKNTYSDSIVSIFISGAIITVLCFVFSSKVATFLGANNDLVLATSNYIRGLSVGFIPMMLISCIIIFLQMTNLNSFSLIATIILVVSNLLLSCINIFVIKGGVIGMGVASSMAQYITLISLIIYKKYKHDFVHLDLKKLNIKDTLEIIILGSPFAFTGILYSVRNISLNSLATSIGGASAISALTIMNTVMAPFDNVNAGVGNVSTSLSSVLVGENNKKSLKILFKESLKIGEKLAFVKLIVIIVFGKILICLFTTDVEITKITYELFICYGICMPINIVLLALLAQFQSLGRVVYVNILYVFGALLFPLAIAYGLNSFLHLWSIWICYALADLLEIVMIFIVAFIKHKRITFNLEDIFDYDSTIEESDSLQVSLKKMEDVINVSKQVESFILDKLNDVRRAKLSGLCIEELAGNIVEHGFVKKKNNKNDSIDVYVAIKDTDINIRVKDNSVPFDLRKKFTFEENDPCKNIGLRVVSKIAKDINYQSSFGMNIVSIKL